MHAKALGFFQPGAVFTFDVLPKWCRTSGFLVAELSTFLTSWSIGGNCRHSALIRNEGWKIFVVVFFYQNGVRR